MNVSCEILFTAETNSTYSACNDTDDHNDFKITSVIDIITVVLSFPTNSYVIWLIVTGTGNGLAAEFFILNLSVNEIFICVESVLVPFSFQFTAVWGVVNVLDGLAFTGCPLFQCLMCVERYLAVVHPVTFLKFKPLRYRVMCSAVVWITGFVYGLFNYMTLYFSLIRWYIISCVVQFFLFLSIQLFCCVSVLRALKQSGPGERGREREEENHMKRRVFYIILVTTVSTVITNAPQIVLFIGLLSSTQDPYVLLTVLYVCFLSAGLVQPVLFLHRVGKLNFIKCH